MPASAKRTAPGRNQSGRHRARPPGGATLVPSGKMAAMANRRPNVTATAAIDLTAAIDRPRATAERTQGAATTGASQRPALAPTRTRRRPAPRARSADRDAGDRPSMDRSCAAQLTSPSRSPWPTRGESIRPTINARTPLWRSVNLSLRSAAPMVIAAHPWVIAATTRLVGRSVSDTMLGQAAPWGSEGGAFSGSALASLGVRARFRARPPRW